MPNIATSWTCGLRVETGAAIFGIPAERRCPCTSWKETPVTKPARDRDAPAFREAFIKAVAVKVAMKRLEFIFTGEHRPPDAKEPATR
jgi:hypothetical protein